MNTPNDKKVTQLHDKVLLILEAAKQNWVYLEGKHLHYLKITVPLPADKTSTFSATDLNNLVRILCNHKQSINCIDNRSWWSDFIEGGCYFISVTQKHPEAVIEINYDIIVLSTIQDIGFHQSDLQKRLRKIFPTSTSEIIFLNSLNVYKDFEEIFLTTHNFKSQVFLESDAFTLHNKYVKRWILEAIGKPVRNIGTFYLMVHQPYNL